MTPRSRRRLLGPRRLLAALAVVLGALVAAAAPASAHAVLESTTPTGGARLQRAPGSVVLQFSEPVEVSLGAIRLYDREGHRVEAGRSHHPGGRSSAVEAALPQLRDGAYVVTWRVISADSHPVHGAFSFRVGTGTAATGEQDLVARLLAADGGSKTVGAVFAGVRFLEFASLLLLTGGAAFCLLLWHDGPTERARRLLLGLWAVALAATALAIGLQGSYAGALPLTDAFKLSVIGDVLATRYGRVLAARLVLLVLALPFLLTVLRPGRGAGRTATARRPAELAVGAVLGAALLLTPGLAGHAATGDLVPLALVADAVHLAAVAAWFGGLTVLALCVLPRGRVDELAGVVPRFSRMAFAAIAVILATGAFQGWRQVGSIDALTSTTYGRLLLVKVGVFVVMVGLGFAGRRWVQARYGVRPARAASPDPAPAATVGAGPGAMRAESDAGQVASFRRSVGAEVVLGLVIVTVTALLVNAQPARSAVAKPFSTELRTSKLLIDVVVDPAKAGPVDVHLYTLSPEGAVAPAPEATAQLTLPSRDIGPLDVPLRVAGPGHWTVAGFDVPIAGSWTLAVTVRLNDFDQVQASTSVRIR